MAEYLVRELAKRVPVEAKETAEERRARIALEGTAAAHEQHRDTVILYAVVATVSVVTVACTFIVAYPHSPADTSRWAGSVLSAIVSGGVGYMTGKAAR